MVEIVIVTPPLPHGPQDHNTMLYIGNSEGGQESLGNGNCGGCVFWMIYHK